ncbi:uncharacterized protein LOC127049744 [Gopherus flavomarginatus]|uniref:uncharacterized protein LOC127049744 n=1 Tax=Gopherus flavomarginatus TaxID=286002 RepID=UPI0021CBD7B7|nr:uncharacterized protein LOC127049744 [Gopherus flavomarginatus]
MPEDSADGEDEEEEEEEDELAESTQHSVLPNSQELFLTQTELPSQLSQASSPDNEAMEATSGMERKSSRDISMKLSWRYSKSLCRRFLGKAALFRPPCCRFFKPPYSIPKAISDKAEEKKDVRQNVLGNMELTRNERAHLNEWKDMVSNYRKDASEREDRRDQREDRRDEREERRDARDERWRQEDQRCRQEDQQWQDAMLGLLRNQTDIFVRLELQEQQQDHRVLLQPLCNHPHHVPYLPHPDV